MLGKQRIFLVGPMGAGKSSVGRQLSRISGLDFFDVDEEIVRRTGVDIPTIFDIEGEQGFRDREEQVLDDLTQHDHAIIATGGGVVTREVNRQHLRSRGTVVYLQCGVDEQLRRTAHDRNRPLLQTNDPRKRLSELLKARDPLYRDVADLLFETRPQPVHVTARALYRQLQDQHFLA